MVADEGPSMSDICPCSRLGTAFSDEILLWRIRTHNDNPMIIATAAIGAMTAPAIQALLVEGDELVDCVGLVAVGIVAPDVMAMAVPDDVVRLTEGEDATFLL